MQTPEKRRPTHRQHLAHYNYRSRGIYHITIVVKYRRRVLGKIEGETEGEAHCELSPLGFKVAECIRAIPYFAKEKGRDVQILAQCVMPDHVHFIIFIKELMDCTLGQLIHGFKVGCNKALKSQREAMEAMGGTTLFEDDFDETLLRRHGQLQTMIAYVHNNPRKSWMKHHQPGLFIPTRNIEIAGKRYDAIGNIFLLGLPRKQVHVRSRWYENERRDYKNACILAARRNVVLVSPFISNDEKAVMMVALREGHSILYLVDNGFTEYAACPGWLLEYCQSGQVLLLVPSEFPHIDRKARITRAECEELNARAEEITRG